MVGTANFVNPTVPLEIVKGLEDYLVRYGHTSVRDIIGKLELNG
jgi:dihydroorotate dehydrogenase (NAD+) catalytic subunit